MSDQTLVSPLNLFPKGQFSLPLADKAIISLDAVSSYITVQNIYHVHYTKFTTLNNITIVTCNKIIYCLSICLNKIIYLKVLFGLSHSNLCEPQITLTAAFENYKAWVPAKCILIWSFDVMLLIHEKSESVQFIDWQF